MPQEKVKFNNVEVKDKFYNNLEENDVNLDDSAIVEELNEIEDSSQIMDRNDMSNFVRSCKNYALVSIYGNGFYVETNDGLITIDGDQIQYKEGIFGDSISKDIVYYQTLIKNRDIIYTIEIE